MLTLDSLKSKREIILLCARRHGVVTLRVFGSVARGESKPGSDVDFLVSFEPNRSLLDEVGLMQELSRLLGVTVDVVSEDGISPYLRDQVLGEAVTL